jgi:hypothetical protein
MREAQQALQDVAKILRDAGWDQAPKGSDSLPRSAVVPTSGTIAGQEGTSGTATTETKRALQDVARILQEAGWDRAGGAVPGQAPELVRHVIRIHFAEIDRARAGLYAQELRQLLLDAIPEVTATLERMDPQAQDAGSSLAVILSSATVALVAQVIKTWLVRRNSTSVVVEARGKKFVASNLTCEQAADLANKLAELFGTTAAPRGQ